ncbi:aminotransferase class III-fold pyridoxal phosphate-dependent enzyme [Colletotrichum scovillei]|uniref:Aminotransferase class III-fold pyridoxal phosphate-dependent enzyme n=1 Tax=Colletotrichum scovillei TaxID=1209932 RepID=A0A9P7RDS1_9PEZI|nr:aminotransferase class III-fold pyridoxal phosphate-dependent enzyme [Colletotrichum scovillei]KAG7074020.1 aminotransferase class III-fold pyridoxal phosphate-dependent enzyme [Colletotrichum scovillei]KAG7080988.1 aminotransferase class III-fold pyridoxal phosphate-dependent enzyme [Colletotrichum scovillei]
MTISGEYLGSSMPFGAFEGWASIMGQFDHGSGTATKLAYSGTFSNNILTMSAVVAAQSQAGRRRGYEGAWKVRGHVSLGMSSCIGLHFTSAKSDKLRDLLFFGFLQRGI